MTKEITFDYMDYKITLSILCSKCKLPMSMFFPSDYKGDMSELILECGNCNIEEKAKLDSLTLEGINKKFGVRTIIKQAMIKDKNTGEYIDYNEWKKKANKH